MYFFALKGVDFLDAVLVVSQERRWASEAFKTECKSWFSLLLKAVEIKKGVENILASFLDSGKAITHHKEYKPHIEAEVCMCVYVQHTNFQAKNVPSTKNVLTMLSFTSIVHMLPDTIS